MTRPVRAGSTCCAALRPSRLPRRRCLPKETCRVLSVRARTTHGRMDRKCTSERRSHAERTWRGGERERERAGAAGAGAVARIP
eukprot:scaffold5076_cov105-Pinguiococcus_pyrenoidosus.AAC.1